MSQSREFWLSSFSNKNTPNWTCPKCGTGILRPIQNQFIANEDSFTILESAKHPDFPDDYRKFKFTLALRCNNVDCQELVVSCGSGFGVIDYDEELKEQFYYEKFVPEYFSPALELFTISKKCPEIVASQIRQSFKLFFADQSASATYVRKAVEEILTNKGIPRFAVSRKGYKTKILLHDRIVVFEVKKPDIAKRLFALKWLGNEGSHANTITKNDLLDAYEILEWAIDDLYVGYKKLIEKKVLKINKSMKPLHPST